MPRVDFGWILVSHVVPHGTPNLLNVMCFFPVSALAQGSLLVGLPKGSPRGPGRDYQRGRRLFPGSLCLKVQNPWSPVLN